MNEHNKHIGKALCFKAASTSNEDLIKLSLIITVLKATNPRVQSL